MARIPDVEIERLKREVNLEALVREAGIELKPHGANLIGRCPFHDDHTPSLVITPQKNLWHCLGACQTGGSVIDWVMRVRSVSFRHAVEHLRGEPERVKATDDQEALRQVVNYYHETLKESPEALRYLESRGLTHPEMIDRFKIGFANRTLGYRLPEKNRKAGAEIRGRLQALGVLRESGHEHFNGSIVIPVFSHCNDGGQNVVGMYGRKITPSLREGTPLHLYLPGLHRGVFNEDAVRASKEVILCESLIDALTFWCAGYRNVTASYGINGFTDEIRNALEGKHVYIAYDRDEAGDHAAERLKEKLRNTTRVLFPKGMDANEYALKVTPASQSFAVLLNKTERPPEPRAEPPPPKANADELTFEYEDRKYRVRGLSKNLSHELMKINLFVGNKRGFFVDTLDLYAARQRAAFTKQATEELSVSEEVLKRDVGRVLLKLEELQNEAIQKALTPSKPEVHISDEDRAEALKMLRDPHLLDRILGDFDIVGEETNKLLAYLACVSRRLDSPLAVVVQSSSAAGKSSLMDAVLAFVPEEERIHYSAMTGQSLYYMGEMDLKHKVLAIAEEEGVSKAAYALKLLQSEGSISIASTGKDPQTGKLVTHQYRVEGPVMIFLTTTAIDLDEELLNRCLVLSVNEDREQTQAIHRMQREAQTLDGLLRKQQQKRLCRLHQNAQRLLEPLFVANPYAHELTFPDHRTRMRRDHMKYLTLIRSIALLHQYQRTIHTAQGVRYIEATREDIAAADKLMQGMLTQSLDEVPPQTRRLLGLIESFTPRFTRKELREFTGWGATQTRVHLDRLVELEYLAVRCEGNGRYVYEVAGGVRPGSGPLAAQVAASLRPTETPINIAPNGVLHHDESKRTSAEA